MRNISNGASKTVSTSAVFAIGVKDFLSESKPITGTTLRRCCKVVEIKSVCFLKNKQKKKNADIGSKVSPLSRKVPFKERYRWKSMMVNLIN